MNILKFTISTLGCKVNQQESDIFAAALFVGGCYSDQCEPADTAWCEGDVKHTCVYVNSPRDWVGNKMETDDCAERGARCMETHPEGERGA